MKNFFKFFARIYDSYEREFDFERRKSEAEFRVKYLEDMLLFKSGKKDNLHSLSYTNDMIEAEINRINFEREQKKKMNDSFFQALNKTNK